MCSILQIHCDSEFFFQKISLILPILLLLTNRYFAFYYLHSEEYANDLLGFILLLVYIL